MENWRPKMARFHRETKKKKQFGAPWQTYSQTESTTKNNKTPSLGAESTNTRIHSHMLVRGHALSSARRSLTCCGFSCLERRSTRLNYLRKTSTKASLCTLLQMKVTHEFDDELNQSYSERTRLLYNARPAIRSCVCTDQRIAASDRSRTTGCVLHCATKLIGSGALLQDLLQSRRRRMK